MRYEMPNKRSSHEVRQEYLQGLTTTLPVSQEVCA